MDDLFVRSGPGGDANMLKDALGSVVAESDGLGATAKQYAYDPFGSTTDTGEISENESRGNLRRIVGELCAVTRDRYERVLLPTDRGTDDRVFDADRYRSTRALDGADVLLVDDTWTTGHSAQSAAWTLEQAGAGTVAMVAVGRHLNPEFKDHGELLKHLPKPFDWDDCVYHRGG